MQVLVKKTGAQPLLECCCSIQKKYHSVSVGHEEKCGVHGP